MKHLDNKYIIEASSSAPTGLSVGGASVSNAEIASGIKAVVDFIKDKFKNLKDWFKKDKTTNDDLEKSLSEYTKYEDLPKELQNAISNVLKKSNLERSDKKKKGDNVADSYDKLKAMLTIIASNINSYVIQNRKYYELVKQYISDLGSDETSTYTKILELGVAAIKEYDENAKKYYYDKPIVLIIVTYCIYKLTDKQGLDNERREEIFKAQGRF